MRRYDVVYEKIGTKSVTLEQKEKKINEHNKHDN